MVAQSILAPVRWLSIFALLGALSACGGGGGGPSSIPQNPQNPQNPAPANVTISGRITFDRIPFKTAPATGLNPNAPVESPARGIVVEAISNGAAIASTVTDAAGNYSVTVPSNTQVSIRAKAQMLKADAAPTWNFRVLNNTNSDALYVLDGSTTSSGSANSTRNLKASTGWTGSSYGSTRAAAPFAILDTVYRAKELMLTASASAAFPALNLYWAGTNVPADPICPDQGQISTTFFTEGGTADASCPQTIEEGIYILGSFESGDTDEFDQHVVAHEFGHYFEAKFSRSDSIGGPHGPGNKLDLRVAFGEGWGNAFSGMVLNDPEYRDSRAGAASESGFNMEQDETTASNGGWFSEATVQQILWDLFDPANEPHDSVALGFGPIFATMTGYERTTSALTSIFSFLTGIKAQLPASASAINQLQNAEPIDGDDDFAEGESHDGGDSSVLPIYRSIFFDSPQTVCVRATNGSYNTLGYRKFFRLDLGSQALVTINVVGAVDPLTPGSAGATDPDIFLHRAGDTFVSDAEGSNQETISQRQLTADTYIIEVFDFDLASGTTPRCMTINVTGS